MKKKHEAMDGKMVFPRGKHCAIIVLCLGLGLMAARERANEGSWSVVPVPDNNYEAFLLKDEKPVLKLAMIAWKPDWVWTGAPHAINVTTRNELMLRSSVSLAEGETGKLRVALEARKKNAKTIIYQYKLSADRDLDLTLLVACFSVVGTHEGETTVTQADG
ncbi:MAG: hypothetical protein PHV97_06590, partial [Candidatus Omnitrophica bacterium]|nr:hypothetical protein [Candidatus Omnitrophota bacterium]